MKFAAPATIPGRAKTVDQNGTDAVGEVDPQRLPVRQPARKLRGRRRRALRRRAADEREQREEEEDDPRHGDPL